MSRKLKEEILWLTLVTKFPFFSYTEKIQTVQTFSIKNIKFGQEMSTVQKELITNETKTVTWNVLFTQVLVQKVNIGLFCISFRDPFGCWPTYVNVLKNTFKVPSTTLKWRLSSVLWRSCWFPSSSHWLVCELCGVRAKCGLTLCWPVCHPFDWWTEWTWAGSTPVLLASSPAESDTTAVHP